MYKESKAVSDTRPAYSEPRARIGQVVVIYDGIYKEYVQRKIGLAYTKEGVWTYKADPKHNPEQKVEGAFDDSDIVDVLKDPI